MRCPTCGKIYTDEDVARVVCGLSGKEMDEHIKKYHETKIVAALGKEVFKHSGCSGILEWAGDGTSICNKCFIKFETKQVKEAEIER